MKNQVEELFEFLDDERQDVRELAIKSVLSLSRTPELLDVFKQEVLMRKLMKLRKDPSAFVQHDAISCLINLSIDEDVVVLLNDDAFLFDLILYMMLPKSIVSDLCCMLLSNMTKNAGIVKKLMPLGEEPEVDSAGKVKTQYLDNMLEVFVRGQDKKYNPNANYHFLACVFANVTASEEGAAFFLGNSTVDGLSRLSRLIPFTEHPDATRRDGVVRTLKNCCFYTEKHREILSREDLNFLPYILLPLCGPEDYSEEEMDGMPDELQFLEATKKREAKASIRLMLVETLVLLTTTRFGRDYLRGKKVYPVIQKLHLVETDDKVKEAIENLVNMIARDEAIENKIVELSDDEDEEDGKAIGN